MATATMVDIITSLFHSRPLNSRASQRLNVEYSLTIRILSTVNQRLIVNCNYNYN